MRNLVEAFVCALIVFLFISMLVFAASYPKVVDKAFQQVAQDMP